MALKAACQDETKSHPYHCLCAGRSLAAHCLSGYTELLCLLDLCVQPDQPEGLICSVDMLPRAHREPPNRHTFLLPHTAATCLVPHAVREWALSSRRFSAARGIHQQGALTASRSTHHQQEALTSRSPMVLSRQSSRWILGVSVCSSAAMRRAPCRRALPNGSSSTPMVVRMADFCKQRRRHCQGPYKWLGVQRARGWARRAAGEGSVCPKLWTKAPIPQVASCIALSTCLYGPRAKGNRKAEDAGLQGQCPKDGLPEP